ncbi:MAG: F0F1 ATP synthase subunit epsilon [Desulfuromonas sp.]|nr:F0F1 ATP synthase subunit epsilon [Desulfuromonas sp.]
MTLCVYLPARKFAEYQQVTRLVVDTPGGSLGFLPRRRDCVTPLSAGILVYQQADKTQQYLAIDTGILVKTGGQVTISVRHAVASDDLTSLQRIVQEEFLQLSEQEKNVRALYAKIESSFVRRFVEFHHDR